MQTDDEDVTETRTPTRLLVPVDDAHDRAAAIDVVKLLAERLGAAVELLSVVHPEVKVTTESSLTYKQLGLEYTTRTVRSASVVDSITEQMQRTGTLLCLPTSARTAVIETLTGSVSAALLRHSTTPILVIGPHCVAAIPGTILAIAVDGTPDSERIVAPALDLAESLQLVPMLYQVLKPGAQYMVADARESSYVARLAERFSRPGLAVQYDVLHDDHPARALTRLTEDANIAVLAMSSHGDAPNERLLLPSIAHGVIRHAHCPVFLGPREAPVAAFEHGPQRRVVVGVDGSPADFAAVRVAVDQAEHYDATLEIVHAWSQSWYFIEGGMTVRGDGEVDRRAAQRILDSAVEQARRVSPSLDITPWLAERLPLDALLEAAIGASVVVVGEHRYNLLERLALGSTTQAVLHRSPVPVIVVPEWVDVTAANRPHAVAAGR